MAKTSTATEVNQESSLREGLEAAIRERVREIIEMVLGEEVEAALGAPRSGRVAERVGHRHGTKQRKLTLRTGTVQLNVPRARLAEADGGERESLHRGILSRNRARWNQEGYGKPAPARALGVMQGMLSRTPPSKQALD